jgi:histidine ammonia-lyase
MTLTLSGQRVDLADFVKVSREGVKVALDDHVRARVGLSRQTLDE